MSTWPFPPELKAQLAQQGARPPLRPRLALCWQGRLVGSVEPAWLEALAQAGGGPFFRQDGAVVHSLAEGEPGLAELAAAMHAAGLAGPWRGELLELVDEGGERLGRIERAAVRPLALRTQAVHLVGCTGDGRVWVQRRALSKPNDPGLLDTLMGGMVSAADGLDSALERETWEEAGLKLGQLRELRRGGALSVCKPSRDGQGAGYMRETLHWYTCELPQGLSPENQDGEVDAFELLTPAEVLAALAQGRFTTEAALVLAAAFG